MRHFHDAVFGCAIALGVVACGTVVAPIDDDTYGRDKVHFMAEMERIAGADAKPCGTLEAPGRNALALACVADAWAARHAFTLVTEQRSEYCPNLVAYAGDAHGRVYLLQSCPDRDHRKRKVLQPSIGECPHFKPPIDNGGFGQCSILDAI